MTDRTDRFLTAYNQIDKAMHALIDEDDYVGFTRAVDLAARRNVVVRQHADDLRALARLRNVIVHEQGTGFLSVPNERAVRMMERVAGLLTDPPPVFPAFRADVFKLQVSDTVAQALAAMYEPGYTQIPLYERGHFRWLLTTRTVARWLGATIEAGPVDLHQTELADLRPYQRSHENVRFVPRTMGVPEAVELFGQRDSKGWRLDAILITEAGEKDQGLLGIITPYDLPRAYDLINGENEP